MEPNEKPAVEGSEHPAASSAPASLTPDETLDWDFQLEVDVSARAAGVIETEVHYAGRARPIPLAAPREANGT